MLALASLVFFGLLVAAIVMVGAFVVRAVLWTIMLPFRIVFGVLALPFWIGGMILKLLFSVVLLPDPPRWGHSVRDSRSGRRHRRDPHAAPPARDCCAPDLGSVPQFRQARYGVTGGRRFHQPVSRS